MWMNEQNAANEFESKITRSSEIYHELRNSILNCTLSPGTKLNVSALRAQFDTGLSPIREALNRLATEGLAQHLDNRGFIVAPVSLPELMDLTRARCWMNDIGVRESIKHGDAAWEEAVLVSCHRLSRTLRTTVEGAIVPDAAWNKAHKAFHQTLVSASGSDWLIDTCSQLFDAAERYRSLACLAGASRSDPQNEHQEIVNAVLDRDEDRAADLLTSHFNRTAELVQTVVSETQPNGFPT